MLPISMCLVVLLASALANPGVNLKFSEKELQRYFGVESEEKAPDYEIVYPEFVTMEQKRHVGRSAIATSYLEVHIDTFGETLRMALDHDDSGFMPGLEAEYVTDEGIIKVPVRTDCLYTGKVVGESDSLASVSACAGLMAVVNHASGPTYIEPLDDEHAIKRDIGRGLPHIAYRSKPNQYMGECGVKDNLNPNHPVPEHKMDKEEGDFEPKATKYLELGLIVDSKLYDLRGSNLGTCVAALFNAVKNVLQLSSLVGTALVPKLTQVTVVASGVKGLDTGSNSKDSLKIASKWAAANNPSGDSRWDNAAVLTGWSMDSGDTLGTAWSNSGAILCAGDYSSTSLVTFRSLSTTNVLAHEIGHNLSMQHVSSSFNIMQKTFSPSEDKKDPGWSSTSKNSYNANIGSVSCYDDA